jgi:acyl transferase domain-containing protein
MVLLEVGPGQALGAWALQHPLSAQVEDRVVLSSLRHSYDNQSDLGFLLNTLGRLWLAGVSPDWSAFYGEHRRRRVPLPSYPFERQRYWVEPQERKKDAPASGRVVSLLKKTDVAEWFYLPLWKQSPPHPAHMLAQFAEGSKCYLVFTDESGVGARLAAELRTAKQEVVVVRAGEGFRKVDEYNFTIAPKQSGDYDTLIRELRSLGRQPQVICHLWSVTREHSLETSVDDVDEYQFAGFYSLLFLAQALGNRNIAGGLRLVVVTNALQAVSGEEKLCPAKATVLGPCRVIPQEYPHITCQSIDITLPAPATPQADQLACQLLLELAAETSEPLVAYRGPHRWLQTFVPVHLESAENRKALLREGGVYLITGGLGGIGLTLAEYIARTVRARLVLIGRGTLPDATQWDAWLKAHDDSDLLSQKIRKVQALEKAGAEVLIASADVTSLPDMEKVIALTHTRFGKIDGLLHAAGVLPGGMMQLKQPEVAGSVLAPKVKGTLVLDAVLADEKLDFFACCSSLNAIYGGFGLVDHCGANAFLDAFAEAGPARGETHRLSINWDGWLEVGQAANVALSTGLRGILNAAHESEETHPLLDKLIVDEPEKEVHSTQLSTTRQWIVNEHRLMGNGVVPGTGYLEMVRAAFEKRAAGGTIEMSKVFFLAPLIVRDGEVKETRTIFTKNKDAYDFSVVSLEDTEAEPLWREHVKGKINHSPLPNSPAQLMSELLARLKPQELTLMEATRRGGLPESDLEKGTNDFRPEDRNFGPRWQNLLQRVGMADLEALAYLELPEEFVADLAQFQLHPSLMDAAVGFTQIAGDGFYLPLAYESIKVHAPLTQKLYSYAKFRNAGAGKNDLLVCDLMLLDEEGNRLVEIQEYTMRRINNLAALKGDAVQNSAAAALGSNGSPAKAPESAAPANAQTTSIISEGILPAEGADAFGRLLSSGLQVPRVAVATRDLQSMIEQSRAMTGTRILEQVNKLQSAQQRHPRPNLAVAYVAPRSEVEERLSGIWQEVLGISEAGIYDNFFDLGGDSLLATLLLGRLGEAFNVDISLRMIFEAPTVADMAITIVQEQAQQIDPDTLTELLATVKNLSTNEIVAALSPE